MLLKVPGTEKQIPAEDFHGEEKPAGFTYGDENEIQGTKLGISKFIQTGTALEICSGRSPQVDRCWDGRREVPLQSYMGASLERLCSYW